MKTRMNGFLSAFGSQDDGNTGTEYAIMLSLIVIVALSGIMALSDKIVAVFERVSQIG